MGSNMMRQSVPLLQPEAPIVGTGLEEKVAIDSRAMLVAIADGVVEYIDGREIIVRYKRTDEERFVSFNDDVVKYNILKFRKTNQSTTIILRPIVKKGQKVFKGQVLTEGYATKGGELALGRNLKVAFMPWKGYNFEDAIVINEKLVREDAFTSIHIDEFVLEVRDTKRGVEELTSDIPNVSEEATKNLDENGLIRVGAYVQPGDILIGKITPKGESDPSPEEKLLRAIFGDKAGDVKDASLKVPPSMHGVIVYKKLFSRQVKERKVKITEKTLLDKIDDEANKKNIELKQHIIEKLFTITNGKTSQGVKDYYSASLIAKGEKFTLKLLQTIDFINVNPNRWTTDKAKNEIIRELLNNYTIKFKEIEADVKRKKFNLTIGDELPAGIVKLAKVYVAQKRTVRVGDKMAGRHGNKGIVSKIVRQEDMPFLEDGTPVDIVLNPLGVPSRMNVGQILETILGFAGKQLGENLRKIIEEKFKRNDFAYLINTHSHPDHIGGNQVFSDAVIVGHENCLNEISVYWKDMEKIKAGLKKVVNQYENQLKSIDPEWQDSLEIYLQKIRYENAYNDLHNNHEVTLPAKAFNDTMSILMGDVTFYLIYFGKAHSGSDILIYIPEEKILIVGDLFSEYGRPSITEPDKINSERWMIVNQWINERLNNIDKVIGGHGQILERKDLQSFIQNITQITKELK